MSIKPIDFQVMMPKVSEVSKIHSDDQQKNQAVLQQQTTSVQHKAEQSLKQVHSQEKSQEARIKEKQEKNQGNGKGKKQNKQGQDEQGKKNHGDFRSSTIDIKI